MNRFLNLYNTNQGLNNAIGSHTKSPKCHVKSHHASESNSRLVRLVICFVVRGVHSRSTCCPTCNNQHNPKYTQQLYLQDTREPKALDTTLVLYYFCLGREKREKGKVAKKQKRQRCGSYSHYHVVD
jgi:hypothetical protein